LRGHTSGYAVPTFVVDAPEGGGKIPVMPNYVLSQGSNRVVLRNYEGVVTTYTEPDSYTNCECEQCKNAPPTEGVVALLTGKKLAIEPANLPRRKRHAKQ